MTYSDQDIVSAIQRKIKGATEDGLWIDINPFDINSSALQPASVDLKLGNELLLFEEGQTIDVSVRRAEMSKLFFNEYYLKPGGFVLGTTVETITIGERIVGKIEGKSSLGRIGLTAHVTAGFVDPGFSGQITLELHNVSPCDIILRPNIYICQIAFSECKTMAVRPYGSDELGSHYQYQVGVQPIK